MQETRSSSPRAVVSAMTAVLAEDLQLPALCYTDPDYYERETRALFKSGWTAIGFASEASDPGKVLPRKILERPLVITRDREHRLRVFDNVCRHRSHRLVESPCDNRKLIVCPYHAWSYSLDGALIKTPYWDGKLNSAPPPALKQTLGLNEIPIAVWYDIIFADLSGEAAPFDAYIQGLEARWGAIYPQDALRRFSSECFHLEGNWKLVAENFLDNYHLPWIHPQAAESIEGALGLDAENLHPAPHIVGFSLAGSGEIKKKTARPLPFWPALDADRRVRQDLFFLFPNVCLVMEGNYFWSMVLLPTAADSCDELVNLYVAGDDAMSTEQQQSRTELADAILEINRQDNRVISNLQAGRRGNPSTTGQFNPHHDQLGIWFHHHVARVMTSG